MKRMTEARKKDKRQIYLIDVQKREKIYREKISKEVIKRRNERREICEEMESRREGDEERWERREGELKKGREKESRDREKEKRTASNNNKSNVLSKCCTLGWVPRLTYKRGKACLGQLHIRDARRLRMLKVL